MQIVLKYLHPIYFAEDRSVHSNIWGQQVIFNRGEKVHIVAPSGSGKTSLMHFLYGLRKEYNGVIQYDATDIRSLNTDELSNYRRNHISIMFQDLRLFPTQTVYQNIELKRQLNPFHPAEKIQEFAERLGVAHKLDMLCSTCSYGEQQRIAIARSLMQPFDFILLDEPFSHLDENNRHKAMSLILEEADRRKAAVVLADLKQLDYFPADRLLHL